MATAHSADQQKLSRIYRPDFAVRLREADFDKIPWQHSFSFADRGMLTESPWNSVIAGTSEWTGMLNGMMLSVGWDFYIAANGDVSCLQAVAPRSNIRLMDAKGYDEDDARTAAAIWRWLSKDF